MVGLEALKRIRQETCPATICPDFDKEECCNIIEKELKEGEKNKQALEIIKKYGLIRYIKEWDCIGTKGYAHDLPQDVVDLLKEVLLCEAKVK